MKNISPFLRILPNILTGSRLIFTAVFLALLAVADADRLNDLDISRLNWSFIMFVIGGLTDIADGPLARRLNVTSSFGRSFDPFVDKILIAGGFILLVIKGQHLTYLAWWMVGVILVREAFVTIVRSLSESQGKQFAATWAGKLKMFIQSFTIGTIVMYMAHFQGEMWAVILRNGCVWITVIFTAISAFIYLPRMKHLRLKPKNIRGR